MMSIKQNKRGHRVYRPQIGITLPTDPTLGAELIQNMYVPEGKTHLESIPGYREVMKLGGEIHTILSQSASGGEYLIIHSGERLFRISKEAIGGEISPSPIAYLKDGWSIGISCGSVVFILDGESLSAVTADGEYRILSRDSSLCSCRSMAYFDGRLFLSGDPGAPGIIYCSSMTKGAIPEKLCESTIPLGPYQITGLSGNAEGLYVMRDDGALIRLVPSDTGYKADMMLGGINPLGVLTVRGRLFIYTADGLYLLCRDGSPKCVSCGVSGILDKSFSILGVYRGYLLLNSHERILMGRIDSLIERGEGWFLIDGIGEYLCDERLFRYSNEYAEDFCYSCDIDGVCHGEVRSIIDENGNTVYFEYDEDFDVLLYPTAERHGGVFIPPSRVMTDGKDIYLGCYSGKIMKFNSETDAEAIGIEHYLFAGHHAKYIVRLHPDSCMGEDVRKTTLPASVNIVFSEGRKSCANLRIRNDQKISLEARLCYSFADFENLDFKGLTNSNAFTLTEPKSLWKTKQIIICGEGEPINLKHIEFGYERKD